MKKAIELVTEEMATMEAKSIIGEAQITVLNELPAPVDPKEVEKKAAAITRMSSDLMFNKRMVELLKIKVAELEKQG